MGKGLQPVGLDTLIVTPTAEPYAGTRAIRFVGLAEVQEVFVPLGICPLARLGRFRHSLSPTHRGGNGDQHTYYHTWGSGYTAFQLARDDFLR